MSRAAGACGIAMELTCEALEARLLAKEPEARRRAVLAGDEGPPLAGRAPGTVPAAVLVGLIERAGGPMVLLTQRTPHLRDHAGQISFPGGRIEAGDADPVRAALREAEEEVGLDPARVRVIGLLSPYDTVTGFRIHPVIGWIKEPVRLCPDPFEVAELFEVPLTFVLDPANHRQGSHDRGGIVRHYHVLPYRHYHIWGATAGILVNLARRVRA